MSAFERVTVSRKTPGDGKLEVSTALAAVLGGHGAQVQVRVAKGEMRGSVTVMDCTCTKAAQSGSHVHHFVQCDAFRDLPVGSELELRGEAGRLDVGGVERQRVISSTLPGADLLNEGLADLRNGEITVAALLVSIGAPRLHMLGYEVPNAISEPEHKLYALLSRENEDSAHGRYNALIRRLVSLERAAACAR